MTYMNNKGADQPAHLRSLISTFVVRFLDSILQILAILEISRVQLVSVDEQAGLSLTWLQTTKTRFLMMWPISCRQTACASAQSHHFGTYM